VTGTARQRRTSEAILEAAAHVLAADADASLDDVAHAADVGRATLYRHFPSREALLAALHAEAVEEMGRRLAEAGLDRVTVPEALERIVRAALIVGDRYRVLRQERRRPDDRARIEEVLGRPILAVFRRGRESGALRPDVPEEILLALFGGLLEQGAELVSSGSASVDDTTGWVSALLLDGIRAA
jgi:AcrR family transcriptional regulator